jgi:cullin 3
VQISDDGERSVLMKLKTECGYQFTSKLESMFTDIKTSQDMMHEYKSQLSQEGPSAKSTVDLSLQVRHLRRVRGGGG